MPVRLLSDAVEALVTNYFPPFFVCVTRQPLSTKMKDHKALEKDYISRYVCGIICGVRRKNTGPGGCFGGHQACGCCSPRSSLWEPRRSPSPSKSTSASSRINRFPSLSFTFGGKPRDTNHALFAEQSPPASTVAAAGGRTNFVHHRQQSSTATPSCFLSLLSKTGFYQHRPPTERHPAPHHQRSFSR